MSALGRAMRRGVGAGRWALALVLGCSGLARTPDGRVLARGGLCQVEDLATRSGVLVVAPFVGMSLRSNGDRLSGAGEFSQVGRYRFQVTGASSTEEPAGITLFLDGVAAGTAFFSGETASTLSFVVDVERAGTLSLVWQLTTDVGQSDTLLDAFQFERVGDLMTEPRPVREGAALLGSYRNVLAERGYARATVDQKIDAAFAQLFHGDPSQAVYRQFGSNAHGPLAVIDEPGFQDLRSEALALGLLLTVQLDHRAEFDALWNAIHSLMEREPTAAFPGSLARALRADGRIKDPAPSVEAEADVATALFFASGRWGDRAAPYDYAAQARRLVRAMRAPSEGGPESSAQPNAVAEPKALRPATRSASPSPRPGKGGVGSPSASASASSLFTQGHQPRAFVDDPRDMPPGALLTSPRHYAPAYFELWARYGPREDALFWQQAVVVARDYLARTSHPVTGLWPGLATLEGEPVARISDPGSVSFRRESWRVLFNLAVDACWWSADPREPELLNRVHAFFVRQGLATYGDAFTRAGEVTSGGHAPGLVAMNAAASTASSDQWGWRFVDELAALPFGLGRRPTSDGLLQLLGLVHAAGRFRVFVPEPPPVSSEGQRVPPVGKRR